MPAVPAPLAATPLPPTSGLGSGFGLNVSPAVGLVTFIGSVVVVGGGYFFALYVSDLLKARKAKKADEEKVINGSVVRAQLPEKTVTGAGGVTIKKAYAAAALATARANLPIITGKRALQPARPSVKKGVFRSLLIAHQQFVEPARFGTRADSMRPGASPLREITNAPADTPVLAYVTAPKANPVSAQSFIAVALASFVARSYQNCDDSDDDSCSEYSDDEDDVVVDFKDAVGELAPSRSAETIAVYTDIQAIFDAIPLACATSSTSTSPPVSIKSAAIKGALGSVTGTPPVLGPSRLGNVQRVDYRTYKRPSAFREYREKKPEDKENTIMLGSSIRLPPRAYLYKIAPAVL
ncbi:hypothetical protein C8R43DRAFT_964666 [Mycena crocata]|nr:hypothetical protein C8R43DRAFT_964666 [Mycena crocata]